MDLVVQGSKRIRVVITNSADEYTYKYVKKIRKECDLRKIDVEVLTAISQEHMDYYTDTRIPTIVLEPCEFTPHQNMINLETNCTANAIIEYCEEYKKMKNLKSPIVFLNNRSKLIGKPLIQKLMDLGYTIISTNSKTEELRTVTLSLVADIIISATGGKANARYLDINSKLVIDVSNDFKNIEDIELLAEEYIDMRMIGHRTTEIMLNQVL